MKNFFISSILLAAISSTAMAENGWKGQGEAGLIKASGNTESANYNIGLGFINERGVWTQEIGLKYLSISSAGVDSAKSLAADYIAKRALSDRSYMFAGLSYLDDDYDGFTEQKSVMFGYGYHVIKTDKVGLELGIGIGYRDTTELLKLEDGTETEGKDLSGETLVALANYRNKITENTEFLNAFKAEIGSDNTYIENEAALIVAMNADFSLKAGVLTRHNTDPAVGSDKTDTITSLNLLYNFGK